MRKILLLSAALVAVLAGPAMAQRGEHGRGGGGERGGRPPAAAPAPQPAPQAAPAPRAAPPAAPQQAQNMWPGAQRNDNRGRPEANRNDNRGGNRPDFNRNNDRRDYGRNDGNRNYGRSDNRRFDNNRSGYRGNYARNDWSRYHRSFNASRRFHFRGGIYHRPAGWYYRRWTFGDFLPSLFWGSTYWINDYYYYDLMPPPPGTVWVRYGDDALLIDRYSGEIIQVEYSVFF
jgi:Ni/Co efflux regulator RcnB